MTEVGNMTHNTKGVPLVVDPVITQDLIGLWQSEPQGNHLKPDFRTGS